MGTDRVGLEQRIAQMEAELAALRAEVADDDRPTTRRELLRRGIVGAAAAGGAALLAAKPAAANDPNDLALGSTTNTASAPTQLRWGSATVMGSNNILTVNDSTLATASGATYPSAIAGWVGKETGNRAGAPHGVTGYTENPAGHGVIGWHPVTGPGAGVFGRGNETIAAAPGVLGEGATGVRGNSAANGGAGVVGVSTGPTSGDGVKGTAGTIAGAGVRGVNTGAGAGVQGESASGPAVDARSSDGVAMYAETTNGAVALLAVTNSDEPAVTGVKGVVEGTGSEVVGVFGDVSSASGPGAAGVLGINRSAESVGYGVHARHDGPGVGLAAFSQAGSAISGHASGETGYDLTLNGNGCMFQKPRTQVPPLPATVHQIGESYRATDGALYLCVEGGTPGVWRKVTAGAPGFASASGSLNFLSRPIRIYDSRPGEPAPLPSSRVKIEPASGVDIQVTGTAVGGLGIPAGAKAVIANLTVTDAGGTGDLRMYPTGTTPIPLTSVINFRAGVDIANGVVMPLDNNGRLTVFCDGAPTHFLLDVSGFVF